MDSKYVPSELARFYHSLPHLNLTFHLTESSFNPSSHIYLESLGIASTAPVVWLLLTLLVLLTYLSSRCCDKNLGRGRSLEPQRWVLGVTAVVCSIVVAVGLYGNDDAHNAIVHASNSLHDVQRTIDTVKHQSQVAKTIPETQTLPLLKQLGNVVDQRRLQNKSLELLAAQLLTETLGNVTTVYDDLTTLENRLANSSNMKSFLEALDLVETIRWPTTMAVMCSFILLCLLLVFAVARRTRSLLVTFAVFGLISIIISFCSSSVYVAVAMATGDLCVNPDAFAQSVVGWNFGADIADYYINCPVDGGSKEAGPLAVLVRQARLGAEKSEQFIKDFTVIAEMNYSPKDVQPALDKLNRSLKTLNQNLTSLAGLVDCRHLNQRYNEAVNATCRRGLFGLTFMLGSALVAGLLFTILVWVDSYVWIYLKKRKGYLQVAEQDPFLPLSSSAGSSRGGGSLNRTGPQSFSTGSGTFPGRHSHTRNTHTPPQTPVFPGTLNGRGSGTQGRVAQPSAPPLLGPNNGQYATLSKSCKTLESSDFY